MVSKANLIGYLDWSDWAIFIAVLGATIASVVYGNSLKEKKSDEGEEGLLELLLMGRKLTLPVFVATLVATWYGGIFGVTALTF
jgi:SSS family solute:Na+ symporter